MSAGPGPHADEPDAHGAHGHAAGEHVPEHGTAKDHAAAHDHHGFVAAASAIGQKSRAHKLRTGLLVAVFTLAGSTLLLELGLRLGHQRERALEHNVTRTNRRWVELSRAGVFREIDDPVRRYAMRPGAEATIDGWRFRVSPQGTRGPEVPAEKPATERRILCLGDSFAFGLWCDEEETVVARLARQANAREAERASGLTWRALDLGVPGYHLGQTLRAFAQEGLALQPDLVVLYFNTNDIEQTGFDYDESLGVLRRDYLPLPEGLKRGLWHASHLYGWIASKYAHAVEDGPAPYLEPRVPWAHVRADNQAYAFDGLRQLAQRCAERKLPLFVIDQPLWTYLGGTRRADWPVLPLDVWIKEACQKLELPALHLLGLLRGYADNVDRFAQGVEPDFLPDQYIADERLQEALTFARAKAQEQGKPWDELPYPEQLQCFAGFPGAIPDDPDFHLTGEGYAHIARLAYDAMQARGFLP
ncbi:MAG: SGNH/GDSL hydrolase family protein [Planctomycetes bacterium]|nr:SGNH/GDSL hydrolase family protein [Planctomycetota bacterium]